MKSLIEWVKNWFEKRRLAKKELATLTKLGWECTCPGCKRLMHTNNLVTAFRESENHWHYDCKCGFVSAWRLDVPCPMYDPSYKEELNVPHH